MNSIDIKHKHSDHLVTIKGHSFKANEAGQWDLTEIWAKLRLPKTKQPGQWRTKEAERLSKMQFLHCAKRGTSNRVYAYKRAVIEYAAWVSPEFKDMVFDAFEAILEMPEVISVVAEKMRELGRVRSAELLESERDIRRETLRALNRGRKRRPLTSEDKEAQKYLRQAQYAEKKDRKEGRWRPAV